ncbi:hypothetical protein GGR20_003693 [Devosia subaequoris]|uniref:BLUF domain-containing protein n=1 Tax=Devosia subaequoris TaxID=395930 RepID=A0A7W6IRS4_9HYPH|nr:BLUF domain-containing protein [Devosia subaequoris]MBB4054021.1 hypothetical protein [Devosia subaequoris]MCP1211555.1 BLUF domain-containing protein [Devosia subaequoris]
MADALEFWSYVSTSQLLEETLPSALNDLVTAAQLKNERLAVTGVLLFTGAHFTQYLEGAPKELRELRQAIETDDRHRDVTTLSQGKISGRSAKQWLAYVQPSVYLDTAVRQAMSSLKTGSSAGVHKLLAILQEFGHLKN